MGSSCGLLGRTTHLHTTYVPLDQPAKPEPQTCTAHPTWLVAFHTTCVKWPVLPENPGLLKL
jgi:hypothetical protein